MCQSPDGNIFLDLHGATWRDKLDSFFKNAVLSQITLTMATTSQTGPGFLSNILTPGSSLNPTFQLILDVAFALLLLVLVGLAILTKGSFHVLALIAIEGCLWASVKW